MIGSAGHLAPLICRNTIKGAHVMKERDGNSDYDLARSFEMRCHRCGEDLPLLHPHIVVERYDDEDNMICDSCFINGNTHEEEDGRQSAR